MTPTGLNGARVDRVDVVVPVHNEAASVARTLRELHEVVTERHGIPVQLVVCEDGSRDGTADVVRRLSNDLPLCLVSSTERKGYSRAVIDGLAVTTSPVVACLDGDGQCDPQDLPRLIEGLGTHDVMIGVRTPRVDHWSRRAVSASFRVAYRSLFPLDVSDPSSPFVVMTRRVVDHLVGSRAGLLPQGFWWEFTARATAAGWHIGQMPVRHRPRTSGATQVYRVRQLPRVALENGSGLYKLRRELGPTKASRAGGH